MNYVRKFCAADLISYGSYDEKVACEKLLQKKGLKGFQVTNIFSGWYNIIPVSKLHLTWHDAFLNILVLASYYLANTNSCHLIHR